MIFGQIAECDNTAVPLQLELPSIPAVRVVWGFQLHDNRQTDRGAGEADRPHDTGLL